MKFNISRQVTKGLIGAFAILTLAIGSITCGGGNSLSVATETVAGVRLEPAEPRTINAGQTAQLKAVISPSTATNKTVTWTSSNANVATVSGSGHDVTVRGISSGSATITVTTKDGSHKATCDVTVVVPATSVSLNKQSITLPAGGSETLTATVQPSNATDRAITWTSNNTNVATVDNNGLVRGVNPGTATIRARTNDGGHTAACSVTVVLATTSGTTIVAGSDHTLALNADGSLWAWGYNNYGQLGDGTYTSRNVPIQVGTARDWKSIAAGDYHTLAIKADGSLWAWGYNGYGQLGDGTGLRNTPVRVGAPAGTAAAAGYELTHNSSAKGGTWVWGTSSQFGDEGQTEPRDESVNPREYLTRVIGDSGLMLNGEIVSQYAGDVRSVYVNGSNDVYTIGYSGDEAVYYLNGISHTLPRSPSSVRVQADSIHVTPNGDVYVLGCEYDDHGTALPMLWKITGGRAQVIRLRDATRRHEAPSISVR